MSARAQTALWAAQRASAAILTACVAVHLATIIYAVHGGLSAGEILDRIHRNSAWGAFYLLFLAAIAIHAPIGLRAILSEWLNLRGRALRATVIGLAVALLALGARAIWAVWA